MLISDEKASKKLGNSSVVNKLVANLLGIEDKEEKKQLTAKQKLELELLQKEIETAKIAVKKLKGEIVTSEEKDLENVVAVLEEKLGMAAPDNMNPHEKITWLMVELKTRKTEEKIRILKDLKSKDFEDNKLAKTVNDGLKKEISQDLKDKAENKDADEIAEILGQLDDNVDNSKQGRMDHKEFIKSLYKLLDTKENKEGKKNKLAFAA